MTTAKNVMKMIKDNDVKYVDFRFTDPRGKWQHVTFDVGMIEEETFAEGQAFDGSSIAGWKAINESDMNLMPDPASACIDPFFAETTLVSGLRCARADHRRAIQQGSSRHRQEGRRHGEVAWPGRHDLFRTGSGILRVRRRQIQSRSLQHRFQSRLDRTAVELRYRLRRRQSRPPHRHQEGLFPGAAAGTRRRTCVPKC